MREIVCLATKTNAKTISKEEGRRETSGNCSGAVGMEAARKVP